MSADLFILMKSEWSLMVIIFILLFFKVGEWVKSQTTVLHITNVLLLLHFLHGLLHPHTGELFSGMFYTKPVIALEKSILNLGTLVISLLAFDWLKTHKHALEFYILTLCTLLGMFFMISSGNFLMFFLGLELSTIPLAALVNFDLERIRSSEAAVKMILSSAFASGITLFGISMLYGTTGTLNFVEMAPYLTGSKLQLLAFIFIFAGFAFKLSAVPFHLWTADVYEGAPVPVTAYLSVISKGSIVFVFVSVLYTLFQNWAEMWYNMLFVTIILTIVIGNLFAMRQENIKRFLAFSSITQVGYILLGMSAGNALGTSSSIYFMIVYVFSNLAVFGVVGLVSAHTGKENISDYKGFYTNNKGLSWVMALGLFSLAGVPPTAGFFGKMFLVTAGAGTGNWILVSIAALNMVVSLYYYLRVVKAIFVDKSETPIGAVKGSVSLNIALVVCVLGVLAFGLASGTFEYINKLVLAGLTSPYFEW
jgi:NADH-quinone oxidoreductase subunit N